MKVEVDGMGYGMIIGALVDKQYQITPELAKQLKRFDKQLNEFCVMTEESKGKVAYNCIEDIIYIRRRDSYVIMPYLSLFRYYGNVGDLNDKSYAIGLFPPDCNSENNWTYCIVANMQYAIQITPEEAFLYINDYEKGKVKAYNICMSMEF